MSALRLPAGQMLSSLRSRLIFNTSPDTHLPTLEASLIGWVLKYFSLDEKDILAVGEAIKEIWEKDRMAIVSVSPEFAKLLHDFDVDALWEEKDEKEN